MMKPSWLPFRALERAVRLAAASLAIAGIGAVNGCLSRPIDPIVPKDTTVIVEQLKQSAVNKIDLLLMVDNSSSMADKQKILALAIPDLINGLVNPSCLDNTTGQPIGSGQPTGPLGLCPSGSTRDFPPVLDIHIGLVSSSLGTFGADGCPDPTMQTACGRGKTDNDQGHLVTRSDPCGAGTAVPTFKNQGFLAWDPRSSALPGSVGDASTLTNDIASLVNGDGEFGCGFESQNESWYRFLVDPSPYQTISLTGQDVTTSGKDSTLLQQRADFLRPDSLLAIIDVTDETDTSIKEYSRYPEFASEGHLPLATSACTKPPPALGPNDRCCVACNQPTPQGCTPDPVCTSANNYYTDTTESVSIRAFGLSGGLMSHKARYGVEFFYQPSRYVAALTRPTVIDETSGKTVANPIYSILPGNDANAVVRDSGLVFYAAITGVPWQLIARTDPATGQPDLIKGVSALDPTQVGGFKSNAELKLLDQTKQHSFWDDIAGDPEHYVPPISPFMQESTVPRMGKDPITGAAILATTTSGVTQTATSGFNGHERTIPSPPSDIQYACIFPLPSSAAMDFRIDCSQKGAICDCPEPDAGAPPTDNPLCAPNPGDSNNLTLQTYAKAYPGVKNLAIARGMGDQGIAASICAKQVDTPSAPDYGYRPAVAAIIARLKNALHNQCLPQTLTWDQTTLSIKSCLVLEGRKVAPGQCNCDGIARQKVTDAEQPAVEAAQAQQASIADGLNCFCAVTQTSGSAQDPTSDLYACLTDPSNTPTDSNGNTPNGWCYVDAAEGTQEAAVVAKCPAGEEREIRFVGQGAAAPNATLFITCSGN